MFKSLTSAVAIALALSVGSAFAADIPSHQPPPAYIPPPPLMTWTGFYIGVNAGYTFGRSKSVYTSVGPIFATPGWPHGGAVDTIPYLTALSAVTSGNGPVNSSGFIGGGQIGYNWQIGNKFVLGTEADIQGVAGSGNSATVVGAAPVPVDVNGNASNYVGFVTARKSLDYLGTVRGRFGFLFTPSLLVYGTGGLAYGGVNASSSVFAANTFYCCVHLPPVFGASAYSNTRVGWTVGGGLEYLFWQKWSAKVEYLYYDLGSVTSGFFVPETDTVTGFNAAYVGQSRARFNGHVVRAGLNYHFNWGAPDPVVAKF
jgi:outer membrane immunogenic protein